MPTFVTPGPISAAVRVAGAQVRVVASDRTDTVVLVEPIDAASKSDVQVASRTQVDFSAGKLTVKTTVAGDKDGSVAITIDLPAGSGLVTDLAYSTIQADGVLGECELAMASGRARLDRVGALQANIARGEVAVGSIAGPAVITGSAVAARIGRAAAGLELSSVSGSLDIDRCDGAVTASTGDTAIRIGRLTHGRAELTNRSGNIEIGVSAGTAARVDASSERASVRNTVPSPDDPGSFDTEVSVRARSRYGDITIARAAS
jgi:hypothetical protein